MRRVLLLVVLATCTATPAVAQLEPRVRHGTPVAREVRELYERGLGYLVAAQESTGTWQCSYGDGPGIAAICCLAILSRGDDPNFGAHAEALRRGLRFVLQAQDPRTGFIAQGRNAHGSMYEHGFAMLALAEAYGAIDEEILWRGAARGDAFSIGHALELAVRAALGSQNANPLGAWRYSPTATDADTSVSGAVLVGLLAARNAGIEVPDANMEKALLYYERSTLADGSVAYSGGLGGGTSMARSAISCLVFALARRKAAPSHLSTLKYLVEHVEDPPEGYPEYTRYYVAQALFQGDVTAWERWNERTTDSLLAEQREDGAIGADPLSTSMSLLALALNFRFLPIYER